MDGTAYHRACFKCCHGGCTISPSNYIAHEGRLYCKHHHIQLFKKKGNYSQLEVEEAAAGETVDESAPEPTPESAPEPAAPATEPTPEPEVQA